MGRVNKTCVLILTLMSIVSISILQTSRLVNAQLPSNQTPAAEWQKTFGGSMVVETSNLIQTIDGGYAFMDLGYTYQCWLTPATVFKVDSQGNQQWNKTIALFAGSSIVQTNDKGYEVTGRWYLPNSASVVTPTLIKMDAHGSIQWVQNYTTLPDLGVNYTTYRFFNQTVGSIITSDGGHVNWINGSLIKTDSSNNTSWVKALTYNVIITSTSAPLILTSVIETSDGAIAVLGIAPAGHSTFPTQGTIYLVKFEQFLPLPAPTQLVTPLPTAPELPWLVIVPLLFSVFVIVLVVVIHRKIPSLNKCS
jgi:hypothetical protein